MALAISVTRAGFCWWGPGANIEDGSSFIALYKSVNFKKYYKQKM